MLTTSLRLQVKAKDRTDMFSISTGHWEANGHLFGRFIWKLLSKNPDLKGKGTAAGEWVLPLHPPFKIQIFV